MAGTPVLQTRLRQRMWRAGPAQGFSESVPDGQEGGAGKA